MRAVPLTHSFLKMLSIIFFLTGQWADVFGFGHIPNILVALSLLQLRMDTSDLVDLWDSLPKQTVGGEIRSCLAVHYSRDMASFL